ncbi:MULTISPECIES: protein Mom [unclassified Crossiella]|uniref:Mom family adenine methylcarbamoylation protein n=1 Tax=unclassified Crossiella TaxID=2620835 RepID=UPI001FFFB028|nr:MULTISPECIES: protein Mom [unclassified Crossiella]MCK2237719.1 protein Mom [Crossiella sp. S99.2]MCK2255005.1 protein Mom [Crossiella sp. S99.1]
MPTEFLVAPCTRAAARYAVENWHYSRSIPVSKLACFGLWEAAKFTGAVVYGRGATSALGRPYGLSQTECVELVRVALTDHATQVSQVLAESLRQLRATTPGLRLVVSFADSGRNHHGGIYQATNWIYTGTTNSQDCYYVVHGQRIHGRSFRTRYTRLTMPGESALDYVRRAVDPDAHRLTEVPVKHRYLFPLDKAMRRRVAHLGRPYPKRSG